MLDVRCRVQARKCMPVSIAGSVLICSAVCHSGQRRNSGDGPAGTPVPTKCVGVGLRAHHLEPDSELEVTSCFAGSGPSVVTKLVHYPIAARFDHCLEFRDTLRITGLLF